MKRVFLLIAVLSFVLCGFGGEAPEAPAADQPESDQPALLSPSPYMIDNFEDGNYTDDPGWWHFDNVTLTVVKNSNYKGGDPKVAAGVGKYSLNIKGKAANWYAGGCGTFVADPRIDFSKYSAISIDVWGNGKDSGKLQVEVYDDDNGSGQLEQDKDKNYAPIADDKFSFQMPIDWKGWKRVVIPFNEFEDVNPGIGDDIWNPGAGGLLQVQVIAISSKKVGNCDFNVDNIVVVK